MYPNINYLEGEFILVNREDETTETPCPLCGCDKPKVFVHGHYQCEDCKCIADGDCCQGAPDGS